VKKILVREAKGSSATHVVVGTTHGLHRIRSSTFVAKYCAKKLSKDCCVLAVNNGKLVFKRDSSPPSLADFQGVRLFLDLIVGILMELVEFSCLSLFSRD